MYFMRQRLQRATMKATAAICCSLALVLVATGGRRGGGLHAASIGRSAILRAPASYRQLEAHPDLQMGDQDDSQMLLNMIVEAMRMRDAGPETDGPGEGEAARVVDGLPEFPREEVRALGPNERPFVPGALSSRDRKANCRMFYWKTMAAC
ncbi:unnamed protein product [Lampetra planeri]